MIILQTAGSGNSGSILGAGLLAPREQVTTFRNNSYIHRLNRTLQSELRAVSAYNHVFFVNREPDLFQEASQVHQNCGKQLIRIIIANRGIPEEKSALSIGLTKHWFRMCASADQPFLERTALMTLNQIEKNLQINYDRLLREAPVSDIQLLEQLKRSSVKQSDLL